MRMFGLCLFLGATLAMSKPVEDLKTLFESQLAARGLEFALLDETRYEIVSESGPISVSLENLSRQFRRDQDAKAINRFLNSILSGRTPLPGWQQARKSIFPILEDSALEVGDNALAKPVSEKTQLILVYFNREAGLIRFLHRADAAVWGISEKERWNSAESSLDAIMQKVTVSYLDANGLKLGVIETSEPLKASLIRAPSLRRQVEEKLGWPIFAVAPSRDFVFLIGKPDADELGRVGASVVKEFRTAEYPLSTEVWEVSDSGIEVIGAFPEN